MLQRYLLCCIYGVIKKSGYVQYIQSVAPTDVEPRNIEGRLHWLFSWKRSALPNCPIQHSSSVPFLDIPYHPAGQRVVCRLLPYYKHLVTGLWWATTETMYKQVSDIFVAIFCSVASQYKLKA